MWEFLPGRNNDPFGFTSPTLRRAPHQVKYTVNRAGYFNRPLWRFSLQTPLTGPPFASVFIEKSASGVLRHSEKLFLPLSFLSFCSKWSETYGPGKQTSRY